MTFRTQALDSPDLDPTVVLLIEDNPEDARLLRECLAEARDARFRVAHVERLSKGLETLAGGGIDLVFVDFSMPDRVGLEGLARIQSAGPGVPIVVLSSRDDEGLAIEAVREGAQDYLVKSHVNASVIIRVARYALERNRVLSRLRHLDGLKTQLVSTVSHEMRTPLAIIREFVALVRDEVPGQINDEQKDCLDSALRNCDRLTSLIDGLLDLARIESGKLEILRVRTDLKTILRQCHDDFTPKCDGKNQSLILDLPPTLRPVLCDPDKVLQVLINLLGNAHKFTPEGGKIVLRARSAPGSTCIEVCDDGVGVSKTDQARIFDSFTQIGREDGPGAQGTGLGLAISRKIVEMHEGTMTLDSTPGTGSCFAFTLPEYNDGAELTAFVGDRLRIYKARKAVASVLLLRARFTQGSNGLPLELLARIEESAGSVLRSRRDEWLLVESEELLVSVIESDHAGTQKALVRLAESLSCRGVDPSQVEYAISEIAPTETVAPVPDQLSFHELSAVARAVLRKRVLIVDDDATIVELVRASLAVSGLDLELLLTHSGYEACIRFGGFEPDLVILDINMPEVDGRQVLSSMIDAGAKNTRFMALSGHPERFAEMREIGCDDCLAKPFAIRALTEKVASLLELEVPVTQET